MGSQVLVHSRSMCGISCIESMKGGNYHFYTRSQVRHRCLHRNTFGRWGSWLVLTIGSSKKLDLTHNTSPSLNFENSKINVNIKLPRFHFNGSWGSQKNKIKQPTSGNPMWSWARWPYLAQESSWCRWGLLPTLQWLGSWLPTYLPSFLYFHQVDKRFHSGNRTANHSIRKWVMYHQASPW